MRAFRKKQDKKQEKVEEGDIVTETTTSQEVSEAAACCLNDIDAVLEVVEGHVPSDEEILANGAPDFEEFLKAKNEYLHQEYDNGSHDDVEYDQIVDLLAEFEKTDEYQRYKLAYENTSGMELSRYQITSVLERDHSCCGYSCCR